MILVVREWSGPVRSYLLQKSWDCSTRDKFRWITEMDSDENWNAQVHIDHDQNVIELRLDRKNNEVEYSAGKRIRIQNLEEFEQLFYDSATDMS